MGEEALMWGSTQKLRFTNADAAAAGYLGIAAPQIANVMHGRPETWTFLIHMHVNELIATVSISISWDLTIGLGRTQIAIRNWATMLLDPNVIDPVTGLPPDRWLVELPHDSPSSYSHGDFKHFPAQTIQLQARCSVSMVDPGALYDVSLTGMFSPIALGRMTHPLSPAMPSTVPPRGGRR